MAVSIQIAPAPAWGWSSSAPTPRAMRCSGPMIERNERIARIQTALREADLEALLCTLPANVLLLSGYWPVVGNAVAVATRDGQVAVLAPKDEGDLARRSWATKVQTYEPA